MTTISPEPTHTAAPAARLLLFLCLFGAAVPERTLAQRPPPTTRPPTPAGAALPPLPAGPAANATAGAPSMRMFSARLGEDLSIADVLGGGEGVIAVRAVDVASVALSVKTRMMNAIAKPGVFADKPDGRFTLPAATSNVSANGSRVGCNVPKVETLTLPDGKRCIPLFQAPNGARLYLVNTLATRQGECLLVADMTIPATATAGAGLAFGR